MKDPALRAVTAAARRPSLWVSYGEGPWISALSRYKSEHISYDLLVDLRLWVKTGDIRR
jgi:hypothetical protein